MKGMVTDRVRDEIKARTDLADLVSSYGVQVRRAGSSLVACCPFHNEKTPSFHIQPDKGFWHCFGCSEHGDAITFVMKTEGLDFMSAVRKLASRTWARGIVTTYSYDTNGSLTNTIYSDSTPNISFAYNRAGRQVRAHDAAGVTTFLYDDFGALTNETVVGVAGTNTIERFYDAFGRDAGYALNGVRQSTLAYNPETARLATMQTGGTYPPSEASAEGGSMRGGVPPVQGEDTFTWSYLPGTDLKSSLSYPNGLTASWAYDANNQLLQVCNATPTNVISQYDYIYDPAGRRVQITRSGSAMSETRTDIYSYNPRGELVSATKLGGSQYPATVEYAYQYDDIGNRISSTEQSPGGSQLVATAYTANSLNQYTSISTSDFGHQTSSFTPQFDDDVLLWGQTSQQG